MIFANEVAEASAPAWNGWGTLRSIGKRPIALRISDKTGEVYWRLTRKMFCFPDSWKIWFFQERQHFFCVWIGNKNLFIRAECLNLKLLWGKKTPRLNRPNKFHIFFSGIVNSDSQLQRVGTKPPFDPFADRIEETEWGTWMISWTTCSLDMYICYDYVKRTIYIGENAYNRDTPLKINMEQNSLKVWFRSFSFLNWVPVVTLPGCNYSLLI